MGGNIMKNKTEKYNKPFDENNVVLPMKEDKFPDPRNYKYTTLVAAEEALPVRIDHSVLLGPCRQQGGLGSCQSFAVNAMLEFAWKQKRNEFQDFSEMFAYYYVRAKNGQQDYNVGAYVIDAIKTPLNNGFTLEKYWPYTESSFTTQPDFIANFTSRIFPLYKPVTSYYKLGIDEVKHALANYRLVGLGMKVYNSFYSTPKSGIMQKPSGSYKGGHMVTIVGYDDNMVIPGYNNGAYKVRNSWGASWGKNGYFYFPYDLFTSSMVFDLYCYLTA
ncbi:MAG: hypothetical protein D4S01_08890 [Dehalococcoidia bacterium]|nr:MAG: hypothetical protein D4S01_08890 [Dehalococcoidia bacterium]